MSDLPESQTEKGQQQESSQGAADDDPGGNSLISFFSDLQDDLWMTQGFIRFKGTSNTPKCVGLKAQLSWEEQEMTSEALAEETLNNAD